MSEIVVCAAQFAPELLNVESNLQTATELVFDAARRGAQVIVLPELCMSGFTLNNRREAALCAQRKDGYQTIAMTQIAESFNCCVVFGYVELTENQLYNSAAIVGPSGLLGNARKHNLLGRDACWASESDSLAPVVVTPAGRLGVLHSSDANNNYRDSYKFYNEDHRFYKQGSVDTLALLALEHSSYAYPHDSWTKLREQTDSNLIVANRVGQERETRFRGGSCVISRDKQVFTQGSSFTKSAVVGGIVLL